MTGTLLSVGLSAAAGNLAAGLCTLCALTVICKLLNNSHVKQMFINVYAKDRIV
jgi:hypothetical protein